MLCQICHKEEATVYVIDIYNGKQLAMYICENCAQQQHLEDMFSKSTMAIHELMSSIFKFSQHTSLIAKPELQCPSCGITFSHFKKSGRFGCANCYDVFRENLIPIFRKFHQAEKHCNKREEKDAFKLDTLMSLKKQLSRAIGEEDFELAIKLRDQIKKMGKTNEHKKK